MLLTKRLSTLAAVVAVALPVVATVSSADQDWGSDFTAVIRYTENGVPHIKANSYTGVGYGYGYASAKENICQIADMYVTLSAQRSKYFGPDSPSNSAVSDASTSLNSDLYFQQVNDSGIVERSFRQPAPLGPRAEARDLVRGYVAGYNRYVAEGGISDPTCKGAPWVRKIADIDIYRHLNALVLLGGEGNLTDGIVSAQPPAGAARKATIPPDVGDRVNAALESNKDMGSNGIAIGRDASATGRGLLLGNPHFPWQGGRRFYQAQLTVPGKFDVSGASLLGMPLPQIGYNSDVAWTHTVSTDVVFGFYQLQLVPGSPTTYLLDGKPEKMTSRKVSVQSRNADGSLSTVERTLWSTRYGSVVGTGLGVPLDWTNDTAYAVRDANTANARGLNAWFELGKSNNTKDVVKALSNTQGIPWVNTIAADKSGNALYANIQAVPNITDELAARCNTPLGAAIFPNTGLAVLDGSKSSCAWVNDRDSLLPGLMGPAKQPRLTRGDYVANSNDSAWLANVREPITGYPRIVGDINTRRGPRTRMAITELDGRKFSRQSIQDLLFKDQSFTADLAVADTVKMCATLPDVADACQAMSKWDNRFTTSSRGALLFQRFWAKVPSNAWKVPFNAADPIGTPNTLDGDNPAVRQAFLSAVADMRAEKIPFDAPLGDNQFVVRNGEKIPVHGASDTFGVLNMLVPVRNQGTVEVVHGSSYIQAVSFDGDRCPDAQTLLTYSQSTNPNSPYFSDQTKLFSQSKWVRGRHCEQDILSSPQLRVVYLRG